MVIKFAFEKTESPILGTIWRPIARVLFQIQKSKQWRPMWMIVDSGADYRHHIEK